MFGNGVAIGMKRIIIATQIAVILEDLVQEIIGCFVVVVGSMRLLCAVLPVAAASSRSTVTTALVLGLFLFR
jgi:hypothetical protein